MSHSSERPCEAKRVLYVATVVKTHIMTFHIPFLKMLKEMGYETAVAARNDYENPEDCQIPYCDTFYDIPFERSPFSKQNLTAYKALKKVIDSNHFDIIHCHTPVGSVLGRLCAIPARKKGTKVFYTAHGFHFYKGAPLKNWLLYYPVEWLCAHFTDVLITINQEDFHRAQRTMHAKRVEYIPGVGIDIQKFCSISVDKKEKRRSLGIPNDAILLLSVGELIRRKNHELVIRAIPQLHNVHYAIAGQGELSSYLKQLIYDLHVEDRVHLLGFRSDVSELYKTADIFVFPSIHEGLPVAVMEAMASGLPCAVSNIRGNSDLISNDTQGLLFDNNLSSISYVLERLLQDAPLRSNLAHAATQGIQQFHQHAVTSALMHFYQSTIAVDVSHLPNFLT